MCDALAHAVHDGARCPPLRESRSLRCMPGATATLGVWGVNPAGDRTAGVARVWEL